MIQLPHLSLSGPNHIMMDGDETKYVSEPEFNLDRYYYDVKEKKFKDWLGAARIFQNQFLIDNANTDFHVYEPDRRSYLIERIQLSVFGRREKKTFEQLQEAMSIKQKIVEASGGDKATVYINVSYLSTFTYVAGDEFQATEIPVFVVKCANDKIRYIDTKCTLFTSISDLLNGIGDRFKGGILYAENLRHKAKTAGGKVALEYMESAACSLKQIEHHSHFNIKETYYRASQLTMCSFIDTFPREI
ncbi:hypothetical protein PENTCL1PPCAC_20711 [Pristionchus entomophagus]|uniref:Uncharacterized protein n=1 Tax=Pristionchus entomophagus TaxID=358040 RepID=A0AAV5TVQ7_9BILA|nr:hypothetical protein PENTCL1PPCAC_20711 [Pristionchus entomophagus]